MKSDFVPFREWSCITINKLFKFSIKTKTEKQEKKQKQNKIKKQKQKRRKNGRKLNTFKGGIVSTTGYISYKILWNVNGH